MTAAHAPDLDAARAYVARHLDACAAEIEGWLRRGELEGPHLAEVARLLRGAAPEMHDDMQKAERLVELAALAAMRELSAWRQAFPDLRFDASTQSIRSGAA
ncbi:hypothetical protein [Rubrivivax gelatinosus]|uniref:hypothetical protein n=1 Tax=Rubrivivax gelatinosus TaxID=28068 RepID=UPI0005C255D1|nr:hypothetical protein [Rubrivivax gelatinosus]MBG6083097.1 hypothetical protein [Rubrivivax gelatinosus]